MSLRILCVIFHPDSVGRAEYLFKISSWQGNNHLIFFNGLPTKIPLRPFGCLEALKHLT